MYLNLFLIKTYIIGNPIIEIAQVYTHSINEVGLSKKNEASPKSFVKCLYISTEEKSLYPVSSLVRIDNINSTT